jgi:hypothetical protein
MLDFQGCASGLVRTFIAHPNQLKTMDASCAAHMPEVHVVGTFPATLGQTTPAAKRPGNTATADARRLAAIGAAVVGDAIWHWWYIPDTSGRGLRGGQFDIVGDGPFDLTLTNVRWTGDVRVDGTGRWDQDTGEVSADLHVRGPGGLTADVTVSYSDYEPGGVATLVGTADGKKLVATVPNP